jgi:hypothetical protein
MKKKEPGRLPHHHLEGGQMSLNWIKDCSLACVKLPGLLFLFISLGPSDAFA